MVKTLEQELRLPYEKFKEIRQYFESVEDMKNTARISPRLTRNLISLDSIRLRDKRD